MSRWLSLMLAMLVGLAIGFIVWADRTERPAEPDDWVARVGDRYISAEEFEREIELRGGNRPGQFFSAEQRRALLDQLLYQEALVQRARAAGIHEKPEVRRSRDQILVNQILQTDLRPRQADADIDPEEIRAFYEANAEEYAIPARRRVAMIFFELGPNASEQSREDTRSRAESVREQALELADEIPDFGMLARENSDHQASRFRGGVIGWIGEGNPSRYSYPEIVVETANASTESGFISPVLEGEDGLFLVRLVDYQPRRTRSLEDLQDGIRQRLLRGRFNAVEEAFRQETLNAANIEIKPGALDRFQPDGAPPEQRPEQPPSLPASQTGGN